MHLPRMHLYGGHPAASAARPAAIVPAIPPPGNCTWTRHNELMAAVDASCRHLGACQPWMTEDELFDRVVAFSNCYVARDQINDECFAGGDQGHREAADNAFRGREACNEVMAGQSLRRTLRNFRG